MRKNECLALCALLLLPFTALAQNWMGAMDSNWNNPANWDQWPLDGENVTIDPANYTGTQSEPNLSGASVFVPDRLYVEGGAVLTIDASLTVADRMIISGPAQVEMTSGTLSTDRLVMDLGGLFHLVNGTVNVGTVLALADGDANDDSRFEQEGGSVLVTGELGFECETGDFEPTYALSGGIFTVNGDVVWFGAAPGSGRPRLMISGGSALINGAIVNTPNSTVDLHIGLSDGALSANGAAIDMPHATDSLVQTGGALHLDNALVWDNDGVMRATAGNAYFDQETELRGTGEFGFHHVHIGTGALLQHTDPAEIEVGGDWNNAGTFDPDMNTVVFMGTGMRAVQATDFHGLRMNTTGGGIQLDGNSSVAGMLTLNAGVIHTQPGDLLVLVQNATASSGSDASHVDGPMRKIGDNAFVFPVGKNGSWRRIGVQDINDQNTAYTAEFIPQPYANTTDLAQGLGSVSTVEHWILTRSGSSDDARVELFWEDASASAISDCSALVVSYWNGAAWEGAISSTTGSCVGSDAGSAESDASVPQYEAFTFGTTNGTLLVGEQKAVQELMPYPQPANTWSRISVVARVTQVELYDAMGRRVPVGYRALADALHVETGPLPPGHYTALLYADDGSVARARMLVVHD